MGFPNWGEGSLTWEKFPHFPVFWKTSLMDVVANQSRYFLEIGARVIFNAKSYVADFSQY